VEHAGPDHRRTTAEIEAGLPDVLRSPRDVGTLDLIVRRPAVDAREVLTRADLGPRTGLVGDNWIGRGTSRAPDRLPQPDRQLTVINSRFAALIAGPDPSSWALAGDQLYVDLDLGIEALPAGSLLAIGDRAVIEVSEHPHTGCAKFAARFGRDAHAMVSTPRGRRLRLRGLNARVVTAGTIRSGDQIRVRPAPDSVSPLRQVAG
jgi:hypothetical protein